MSSEMSNYSIRNNSWEMQGFSFIMQYTSVKVVINIIFFNQRFVTTIFVNKQEYQFV